MEGAGLLIAAASAVLFGVGAFFLVDTVLAIAVDKRRGYRGRSRVTQGFEVDSADGAQVSASIVTVREEGRIADFLWEDERGQGILAKIRESGVSSAPAMFVSRVFMAAGVVGLALTLVARNPFPGLVSSVAVVALALFWVDGLARDRLDKMRGQLPDAFTLVGNSLGSGLSLVQALEYAAVETDAPLGPELWVLVSDVKGGRSLSEALERFRLRMPLRELQTITSAVDIQHRAGGNIREMLEQATASVRTSLELKMSLQAKTAQGRSSSRLVALLPFGLTGIMSLMSSDYRESLYGTTTGLAILVAALTLNLIAFAIIRKLLDIEI